MAFNTITAQGMTPSGLDPTYAAATLTDGDQFRNNGREIVHIKNGGGVTCNVSIATPAEIGGLEIEDIAIAILAGEERFISGLDPALFNQPAGTTDAGQTQITYDQVASVTIAVFLP